MNIEHISVSRKQCYDLCQAQYKYKYHLKLVTETIEPPYFAYGKLLHKAAECYVREGGRTPIQGIAREILSGDILLEDGRQNPQFDPEYLTKLPGHLRAVETLTKKIGFDGEIEWPFYFDLDPPHGRHIKGFIDRLIRRGDKFFIIDYKTTKKGFWRKTRATAPKDLQLRAYARIVQKEFNVPAENIQAALYYVEGGDLVAAKFTQDLLDSVERDLRDTYVTIAEQHPDSVIGRVGDHCRRCDFRRVCSFYSLT